MKTIYLLRRSTNTPDELVYYVTKNSSMVTTNRGTAARFDDYDSAQTAAKRAIENDANDPMRYSDHYYYSIEKYFVKIK